MTKLKFAVFCFFTSTSLVVRNDSKNCSGDMQAEKDFESHCPKLILTITNLACDQCFYLPKPAPINSCLHVVVRSPTPFGLGQNGCWPSRGSQLPRALPFIFSLCCLLNDRSRAARSFFKIGRLFSLFPFFLLFSCPSSSPHYSCSLDER